MFTEVKNGIIKALKNDTTDTDGDDNSSHFEDRGKPLAVTAIKLCNAQSKVRQRQILEFIQHKKRQISSN